MLTCTRAGGWRVVTSGLVVMFLTYISTMEPVQSEILHKMERCGITEDGKKVV